MKTALQTNPTETRKRSRLLDVEVGQCIRVHRKNARMTLQVLADRLGIAYQQVQKYETGVNRVGAGRLMEIAEILDIPVASFFRHHNVPVDEVLSSSDLTPVPDTSPDLALQGRQLLVTFLRIKDPAKRKAALAYLHSLADGEMS